MKSSLESLCFNQFLLHPTNLTPIPHSLPDEYKSLIELVFSMNLKAIINAKDILPSPTHKTFLLLFRTLLYKAKQAQNLLLIKENPIKELNSFSEDLNNCLKSFLISFPYAETLIFLCFYTFLTLFLKENFLGGSYLFLDATKRLSRDRKAIIPPKPKALLQIDLPSYGPFELIREEIKEYGLPYVKSKDCIEGKGFHTVLGAEGEVLPVQVRYPQFIWIMKEILEVLYKENPKVFGLKLWKARVLFIHNRLLDQTPLQLFKREIFELLGEFFKGILEEKEVYRESLQGRRALAMLCIEIGYCQAFYYKYKAAEASLAQAKEFLGFNITFTGKLGLKTKYQTFTVPILVMEAQHMGYSEGEQVIKEEEEEKVPVPKAEDCLTKSNNPLNILLDQDSDNILYETPKFIETPAFIKENSKTDELLKEDLPSNIKETSIMNDPSIIKKTSNEESKETLSLGKPLDSLDAFEQAFVLFYLELLLKSHAKDELQKEQVSAALDLLLKRSENWLLYSKGLYFRSLNEFPSYKRRERSILQIASLVEQFEDRTPELFQRSSFFFPLNYPAKHELQKKNAEILMQNGNVLSSCELFKKLGMLEECVECLAMAGIISQAKEMALHLKSLGLETPKLLLLLGELFSDPLYYKASWKLSKKRFYRAQRALGRYYMGKKDFIKAIKAFKRSLGINSYDSGTWFSLGCLLLSLDEGKQAIEAFGACVRIDESNAEGWANLAASFMKEGRRKEAFSCSEQAVKYHENSWRMWSNLMILSLESRHFSRFLESVQRLLQLDRKEELTLPVLLKILQVFQYFLDSFIDRKSPKRSLDFYKALVERTLKLAGEKMAEKYEVWEVWAEYYKVLIVYYKVTDLRRQEEALIEEDPNNEVKVKKSVGFNIIGSDEIINKASFSKKIDEALKMVYLQRMKSCQSLMIIGWETTIPLLKQLMEQTEKLIKDYKALPEPKDPTELQLYLAVLNKRAEKGLEEDFKPIILDL